MSIADFISTPVIKAGKEIHTACPFCNDGKDRFVVFEDGRAWCRRCNWAGDTIAFLMQRDHLTYPEACNVLHIEPRKPVEKTRQKPAVRFTSAKQHEHDVQSWRQSAHKLWQRASDVFIDDYLDHGVTYQFLASRGLSVAGGRFGYIPTEYKAVWGGLQLTVPQGLMIAWYETLDSEPYKLNIRRFNPTPNQDKYHQLKGSQTGLYLSHLINPKTIVVLVEGELDALSVYQSTPRCIAPVATGSTTGGQLLMSIARLAVAYRVLVAFDTDESGEKASEYWLNLLPNAKRLKPLAHDVNDMLTSGMDIREWILKAVS